MSATTADTPAPNAAIRRSHRSAAIEGLRGLIALALLSSHVAMVSGLIGTKETGATNPPTNALGGMIASGLQITAAVFFVLTAFFTYRPLAKAIITGEKLPRQGGNLLRRGARLLPAYWLMCAVALIALNRDSIHNVWYVLRPMALLHIYFWAGWINGLEVTWTVPAMAIFYLMLPGLAWATQKYARGGATERARAYRLMLPVPVLIAVGFGWLFYSRAHNMGTRALFWWPMGLLPQIGIGMALAILLALRQASRKDTPKVLKLAAEHPNYFLLGALVMLIINCIRPFSEIGMDDIYTLSGLLTFYVLNSMFGLLAVLALVAPERKTRLIQGIFANKPVAYLGKISYGVYLWHFVVMHFFLQPGNILSGQVKGIVFVYHTRGFWELEAVALAGSVAIASLSYYLVERPIIDWVERYLARRVESDPAALTAPAATLNGTAAKILSREEATAAVAALTADREAIQANLLDLDRSFGRRLLAGSSLSGRTKRRWETASTELATLWEIFIAYSAVVDRAAETLAGGRRPGQPELALVTNLLKAASVQVVRAPAPLLSRDVTDNGHSEYTVAAAVREMRRLFSRVAEVVTAAETVWNELTDSLEQIGRDLAEARRRANGHADETLTAALNAADTELRNRHALLSSDPLALWQRGHVEGTALDQLREQAAAVSSRVDELCGVSDEAAALSDEALTD